MDPTLLSADPELRAAARKGRELARRAMPATPAVWIDRLSELAGPPDLVWGVVGASVGAAIEFERAFQRGGTHVRDLVFAWHKVIREPQSAFALPGDLGGFEQWLRGRMGEGHADSREWRAVFYQWVDVASERLTQRHYPRTDDRARHARALVAGPLKLAGFELPPRATEWLLRFHDLLVAEESAARGFNRLVPADGWGGFYGMSGETPSLDAEAITLSTRALLDELSQMSAAAGLPERLQEVIESIEHEMRAALTIRSESGGWPADFRVPTSEVRLKRPSIWRRLLGF